MGGSVIDDVHLVGIRGFKIVVTGVIRQDDALIVNDAFLVLTCVLTHVRGQGNIDSWIRRLLRLRWLACHLSK